MQFDIDMQSENKDLFLEARKIILSFEGMQETRKTRITTYSTEKGGICHMRTMPHGIDIGFLKGAKMRDTLNRLSGKGKAMRVLSLNTLDEQAIRTYLEQAIELNGS